MTNDGWRKLQCGSTRYQPPDWTLDWKNYKIRLYFFDQSFEWTSRHHGSEGLKGALNCVLIMPRDASLSDSRCEFFLSCARNISFIIEPVFKTNIELLNYFNSWNIDIELFSDVWNHTRFIPSVHSVQGSVIDIMRRYIYNHIYIYIYVCRYMANLQTGKTTVMRRASYNRLRNWGH